jgi:hypothetical protein
VVDCAISDTVEIKRGGILSNYDLHRILSSVLLPFPCSSRGSVRYAVDLSCVEYALLANLNGEALQGGLVYEREP